jgi:hypothetical protein
MVPPGLEAMTEDNQRRMLAFGSLAALLSVDPFQRGAVLQ